MHDDDDDRAARLAHLDEFEPTLSLAVDACPRCLRLIRPTVIEIRGSRVVLGYRSPCCDWTWSVRRTRRGAAAWAAYIASVPLGAGEPL